MVPIGDGYLSPEHEHRCPLCDNTWVCPGEECRQREQWCSKCTAYFEESEFFRNSLDELSNREIIEISRDIRATLSGGHLDEDLRFLEETKLRDLRHQLGARLKSSQLLPSDADNLSLELRHLEDALVKISPGASTYAPTERVIDDPAEYFSHPPQVFWGFPLSVGSVGLFVALVQWLIKTAPWLEHLVMVSGWLVGVFFFGGLIVTFQGLVRWLSRASGRASEAWVMLALGLFFLIAIQALPWQADLESSEWGPLFLALLRSFVIVLIISSSYLIYRDHKKRPR